MIKQMPLAEKLPRALVYLNFLTIGYITLSLSARMVRNSRFSTITPVRIHNRF